MENYQIGLSSKQVQERIDEGLVNGTSKSASKTYYQIFKENIWTLFNLLNFLIFIALVMVKAWSNTIFMAIIVCNAIIGIIQEIKAKKQVDQLSILTKPLITVIRDSKVQTIDISKVVMDDILVLESGNQVCNDAIVVEGMIEANESLLTGEVDPINKTAGSKLLSGSSVVSGNVMPKLLVPEIITMLQHLLKRLKKSKKLIQN